MCKYFLHSYRIHNTNTLVNITTTTRTRETLVQAGKLLFHCVKLITVFMFVLSLTCLILFA